jgi:hypothetical protein
LRPRRFTRFTEIHREFPGFTRLGTRERVIFQMQRAIMQRAKGANR